MDKSSLYYEVVPGLLFAGGCPWEKNPENGLFNDLITLGIRDFITLRDDVNIDEIRSSMHFKFPDVTIQQFPITDFSIPDELLLHRILQAMVQQIADGKQIYIGCAKGLGRTGLIIACFLSVHHGISGQEGIKLMNELRIQGNFHPDCASPETSRQIELVNNFEYMAQTLLV